MKRTLLRTLLIIILAAMIAFATIGCEHRESSIENDNRTIDGYSVRFHKVGDEDLDKEGKTKYDFVELTYDVKTRIVYIRNYGSHFYTTLTPYYSENGKLCRYIDGEIVEIDN